MTSQYALKEIIAHLKEESSEDLSYETNDPQYFIFYQLKEHFIVTVVSLEIYTVLAQMSAGLEIGEIIEKHNLSHAGSDFSNIFMFMFENGLVSAVRESDQ